MKEENNAELTLDEKVALADQKAEELRELGETVSLIPNVHFHVDENDYLFKYKKAALVQEFADSLWLLGDKDADVKYEGRCSKCGERVNYIWDTERNEITCESIDKSIADKCEGDFKTLEFELTMQTGELVFFDWIKVLNPISDSMKNLPSINYDLGIKKTVEAYAEKNIAHMFVGNTSPSIYKKGDTLTVGGCFNDEDEWPETYDEDQEYLGYVCTDLWWATLVDKATLIDVLSQWSTEEEVNDCLKESYVATNKIKPGVYKCTYLGYGDDVDVYANLEWVRDVD